MSLRGQCRAAASDNCEFEACSMHWVMLECWIYAILSWLKHWRQSTLRWVLCVCISVGVWRQAWCVVMGLCQCVAAVDRWPSELCERQWRLQEPHQCGLVMLARCVYLQTIIAMGSKQHTTDDMYGCWECLCLIFLFLMWNHLVGV